MNRGVNRLRVGVVCSIVLFAVAGLAQEKGPQRADTRADPVDSSLPYSQRVKRWRELTSQGDPASALALGESVVAEGGPLMNQVWTRAALATQYIDHGGFERARELIAQAAERAASFLFRAAPDDGVAGHAKQHALYELQRAQCKWATQLFRHEESAAVCALAVVSARKARELARFSGRGAGQGQGDYLNALLDRAQADRMAGRRRDAQQSLALASEVVSSGSPGRGAAAHFYRVASQMAVDLGDKRQAREWARRAVSVWDGDDDSGVHAARLKGRTTLQIALVFGGEWQEANDEFDSFDAATRGNRLATAARGNILARALAYAHAGRLPQLRARLDNAWNNWRQRLGADHPETAVREGLLGAAMRAGAGDAAGRAAGNAALLHAAQTLLEAQRRGDVLRDQGIEGLATRFVLEQFLRSRQSEPAAPEAPASILAFQVADHLRGTRVQGAIQDAAVRSALNAAGLGDLVRREQDSRNELRALQDVLAGQLTESDEGLDRATITRLNQRVAELEASRTRWHAEIAKAFPGYDALVHPRLPGTAEVIRQLALGELFVSMLPVEGGVHLWALSWTEQSYRFVAVDPLDLARAVAAIRRSTDFDQGPLPPYAAAAAWQLHRDLLAPLAPQLAGTRHLIVAAAGVLGSVPFAALLTAPWDGKAETEAPWLIRRMAVSQVPGASAWLAIQRLGSGPRPAEPLLAWGDPAFAVAAAAPRPEPAGRRAFDTRAGFEPAPGQAPAALRYADIPALPETRAELQAIAATLQADPSRDLLLGERATRQSVLAANASGALARKRVLAFATHGLVAGDLPNLDQPALALAATADAQDNPLAPLLKLDDVLGLKLNADWVVLSACNTAAADGKAEEALSGLARGFFYAGARSLLVTHWAVETESATLLTTGTFEHYASNPYAGKAESLRQAMLKVMALPKYGHPAFWAPYALVGDGAR